MMENLGKCKSICKPKIQGNAYTRIFKVPMTQKIIAACLFERLLKNNEEWHLRSWNIFFHFGHIFHQEPITWSLHLSYKSYETTFVCTCLLSENAGLLDSHTLYTTGSTIFKQ